MTDDKITEFNSEYEDAGVIEKLKKKIAKKAREPFSFWCTFFGAFADLFR